MIGMMSTQRIVKSLIILSSVIVLVGSTTACVTRRCLAEEFIKKKQYSAPQHPECIINVNLTSIQYQTLSVDTKAMQFSSRIKITMEWKDPDLTWSDSQYEFEELLLPFNKIWTPDLTVANAVYVDVKPVSSDILVQSDGTVNYAIIMYTTVVCRINLLTYPFVQGACPVAINGWNQSSCGLNLEYGSVSSVGSGRGEWQTLSVELYGNEDTPNRNFLQVTMSINPFNAMVSLVLPSALIMVADLVSFALPLEGGKRSSFKITLVLSFTMFLLILTSHLPDTGACSPLIRYHFCFCLFVLVLSMLTSMVFTKLATDGSIRPFKLKELRKSGRFKTQLGYLNMNGAVTKSAGLTKEGNSLEKIVSFVENIDKKEKKIKMRQTFANNLDKICFWIYLSLDIIYSVCVTILTRTEYCKFNNLDFWE
ncbi:5-hydroxytryptamine receptor 3A-like [Colossoma macropomum]|uniref:5-hydroxytryptamine receptor 3A-like n=1 Tax=Colossoma macropomum TaxID=42526 RepID=UPI00186400B0|nr:5-hydroxytryptamine receptor 3A-like [Colossoma macropomum]